MARLEPWERRADETPPAFAAFAAYRDAGPSRSIGATAKSMNKTARWCERLSSRHGWVSRVRAFDAAQDRLWQREAAHGRRQAARRSGTLAEQAKALAERAMVAASAAGSDEITLRDAARLAEAAVRLDASAYGAPEARLAVRAAEEHSQLRRDVEALSDEDQLVALRALRAEVDRAIAEMEPPAHEGES